MVEVMLIIAGVLAYLLMIPFTWRYISRTLDNFDESPAPLLSLVWPLYLPFILFAPLFRWSARMGDALVDGQEERERKKRLARAEQEAKKRKEERQQQVERQRVEDEIQKLDQELLLDDEEQSQNKRVA